MASTLALQSSINWWARTIFIHELLRIADERASLQASEFAILYNKWIKTYKRTNHEVICLLY